MRVRFRTICDSHFFHRLLRLRTDCCWYGHLRTIFFSTCWRGFCAAGLIMPSLVRNRTNKYHYSCLFHFLVRFRTDLSQLLEQFQTDYRYYSSNSWYDFVPIIAGEDLYA